VTRAVLAAAAELKTAEAEFGTAQTRATAAREALAQASAVAQSTRADLHVAELAEDRARRDLADVRARIAARQTELGRLARNAYQESGPLAEWAVALDSETPQDLAARLGFLRAIANIGNGILDDLREARADLVVALDRLAAVRAERAQATAKATEALASAQARAAEAATAEQDLATVVARRTTALNAARQALAEDQRRYLALQVTSGHLATRIRELAAENARSAHPPKGTGSFIRPSLGPQTSPFGPRFHPILHYVRMHTGLDLGRGDGLIYAADDGVVMLTEYNGGYGNMTVIDHGTIAGQHVSTVYGHQARFLVLPGQAVVKGQVIGVIGSTGLSTGPHLHFEVRIDGVPEDPAPWLVGAPLPKSVPTPTSVRVP
jgi:murein DD-endopeptidase MepM/ murein hydrolase activator NlpD